MSLVVRFPKIDYSDFRFYWSHNMAFSMDRNATAIIPAPVEPWLIKTVQEAMPLLPPGHAQLREEVKNFVAQESQHFRQHGKFNRMMVKAGFPRLADMEKGLAADLEAFSRTKSLKWRLAYADGFESLGAVSGKIWFEMSDEMIKGLDNAAIRMWKWHMAEEYEHREVCFQFYKALYCQGWWRRIVNGYFFRVYGFFFAVWHLRGFAARAVRYMRELELARMGAAEKAQFEKDVKAFRKFNRRVFLRPLLANLLPWYDPGRKPVPQGLFEYLRHFEKDGQWSAGTPQARQP